MMDQEINDMASKAKATKRVTLSPCVHKLIKPYEDSIDVFTVVISG
jgi:hypothetical protein